MNYYEHHIGDYAAATAHLSLVEDAIYSRLLRRYYLQEEPLPTDVRQVARLVGARSPGEVEAVDVVLGEFFVLADDGWHNKRADEEIERYQVKQDKARASANARWSRDTQQAQCEGNANALRTHSEGNALQTPDTSNQAEKQKAGAARSPNGSRLPADWAPSADDIDFAVAERPEVDWRAEAEKFRDYWHGVAGAKGRKANWQSTWRNWIRRADSPRGVARAGPGNVQQMGKTAQALMALEEFGNGGLDQAGNFGGPETAHVLGQGADTGGRGYPADRRRLVGGGN
ncbi:YdaU family protein [Stenotrophomonas sp. AB1(2024)]|uniref:YdaU family protein n=1 Tax=Stenotrophomonas sp. AB1(2024) TaxID=3132215 RepID=UPI0030A54D84